MRLQPNTVCRIAFDVENRALHGTRVIFLRYVKRWFDAERAEVAQINTDGKQGQKWLILPYLLIKN